MGTSWAMRWRELLTGDDDKAARRLTQGRAYHRSGRVLELGVATGVLSGRVQGGRATPRVVEVTVAELPAEAWERVVGVLTGQLRHSARLLAGLQPEGLAEELAATGVDLLPGADDVEVSCGCGGPQPCAHAAAVWEAGAESIEEDPFVLLRLRGRGRERLLAELAGARGRGAEHDLAARPLADLDVAGWTQARAPLEDLRLPHDSPAGGTPLRVLGNPPGWPRGPDADELFGPLVEAAVRWAADLQRGETATGTPS